MKTRDTVNKAYERHVKARNQRGKSSQRIKDVNGRATNQSVKVDTKFLNLTDSKAKIHKYK